MKILLIFTGKTTEKYLIEPINEYMTRIQNYFSADVFTTRDFRLQHLTDKEVLKRAEADEINRYIENNDYVVLLDEKGETFSSAEFAQFIQSQMNRNTRRLVFVIGGAYGFSQEMYQRANMLLSLSRMTFTHQMTRLIFVEQLYRACTILKGEPYHH